MNKMYAYIQCYVNISYISFSKLYTLYCIIYINIFALKLSDTYDNHLIILREMVIILKKRFMCIIANPFLSIEKQFNVDKK